MNPHQTLIYIATTGSSVFESQVICFLKEIKKKQLFNRVILLAGVKKNQNWQEELSRLSNTGFDVILYRQYPSYFFYNFLQKNEFSILLNRILTNNSIIHIRGELLSGILFGIIKSSTYTNVKIVTDIRGAGAEEVRLYLRNSYNPIKFQLKLNNYSTQIKEISGNSDYISCVSPSLKEYLQQKSQIGFTKLGVNHCSVGNDFTYSNQKRTEYREKLKLTEGDILFIFVTGGFGLYEKTDNIVNYLIKMGYKFLNLSKKKIENAINLYVPYSEVPYYLCAADIGIILRNNDVVNNVASPVKFSEYVCCGLPVIANNGVNLINDYIKETGFGKIINEDEYIDDKTIKNLLTIDRKTISLRGQRQFSSETIIGNYLTIYKTLLSPNQK
jgi:hypothetical protein